MLPSKCNLSLVTRRELQTPWSVWLIKSTFTYKKRTSNPLKCLIEQVYLYLQEENFKPLEVFDWASLPLLTRRELQTPWSVWLSKSTFTYKKRTSNPLKCLIEQVYLYLQEENFKPLEVFDWASLPLLTRRELQTPWSVWLSKSTFTYKKRTSNPLKCLIEQVYLYLQEENFKPLEVFDWASLPLLTRRELQTPWSVWLSKSTFTYKKRTSNPLKCLTDQVYLYLQEENFKPL